MNFAMFPTTKGESVSPYVARIVSMLTREGCTYQLTAMGTIVETNELSRALELIRLAYAELEPDCSRVYTSINLDIRKEGEGRILSKVESVGKKMKLK